MGLQSSLEPAFPSTTSFDYLEGGDAIVEFLDQFPTVSREQVLGVLELARGLLLSHNEVAA